MFSPIDEALLKAELIRVARRLRFPEFDRDGEFLAHHSVDDLIATLGHPNDDVVNTFTARLLLLLESRPLLEPNVYEVIIRRVVEAYWIDYAGHEDRFVPAFLANDVLRLWRTFCVNYEAFTKREPDVEKAKRRLRNYKLRHSRLLTCYSALIYLLEVYRSNGTVRPEDVVEMASLAPIARLRWLSERRAGTVIAEQSRLSIDCYERFLSITDTTKEALIEAFLDNERRRSFTSSEYEFGDAIYRLIQLIAPDSIMHRVLSV